MCGLPWIGTCAAVDGTRAAVDGTRAAVDGTRAAAEDLGGCHKGGGRTRRRGGGAGGGALGATLTMRRTQSGGGRTNTAPRPHHARRGGGGLPPDRMGREKTARGGNGGGSRMTPRVVENGCAFPDTVRLAPRIPPQRRTGPHPNGAELHSAREGVDTAMFADAAIVVEVKEARRVRLAPRLPPPRRTGSTRVSPSTRAADLCDLVQPQRRVRVGQGGHVPHLPSRTRATSSSRDGPPRPSDTAGGGS